MNIAICNDCVLEVADHMFFFSGSLIKPFGGQAYAQCSKCCHRKPVRIMYRYTQHQIITMETNTMRLREAYDRMEKENMLLKEHIRHAPGGEAALEALVLSTTLKTDYFVQQIKKWKATKNLTSH